MFWFPRQFLLNFRNRKLSFTFKLGSVFKVVSGEETKTFPLRKLKKLISRDSVYLKQKKTTKNNKQKKKKIIQRFLFFKKKD